MRQFERGNEKNMERWKTPKDQGEPKELQIEELYNLDEKVKYYDGFLTSKTRELINKVEAGTMTQEQAEDLLYNELYKEVCCDLDFEGIPANINKNQLAESMAGDVLCEFNSFNKDLYMSDAECLTPLTEEEQAHYYYLKSLDIYEMTAEERHYFNFLLNRVLAQKQKA